ncbi:hypothetical protein ACGF12_13725 [Kitasatospora sp. NPDC048296]|uniref:hypothetical protein n=1 Tax=Kitasatospora sp. NPDC048296 TaxID=3364048 RepID=UPI0037202081
MTTSTEPPTHPAQAPDPGRRTLTAAVRDRWSAATAPDAFLDRRRQDLVRALDHGWREGPRWVRLLTPALIALTVIGGALVLYWAGRQILAAGPGSAWWTATSSTITGPVYRYLDQHTAGLPLTSTGAYRAWQFTGLAAALLSCALRSFVARLTWASWVAATLAAVWQASPPGGRTVATALTATVLAAASVPALRGLTVSLRPQITVHRTVQRIVPAAPVLRLARPLAVVPSPGRPLDPS